MFSRPWNCERTSILEHEHNRFSGSYHCFEEFLLIARQIQLSSIESFS